jgi:hypothetical protein
MAGSILVMRASSLSACEGRFQMFAVLQGRQSQSPLRSFFAWIKAGAGSEFGCCDEVEIERIAKDMRMSAS